MKNRQTINVLVDDFSDLRTKHALSDLGSALQDMVVLDVEQLGEKIRHNLQSVAAMVSKCQYEDATFELAEVRFTLAVSRTGEVSLLSLAKGAITGQTGIEFVLTKKQ